MTKIITKNREFEVFKQDKQNYFRKLPEEYIYKIKKTFLEFKAFLVLEKISILTKNEPKSSKINMRNMPKSNLVQILW